MGQYELTVVCNNSEGFKQIQLNQMHQFEVVVLAERTVVSDHVKPKLVVKLDRPTPNRETWWIRFTGVYNETTYTDQFTWKAGTAQITDPDPGSYLVTVFSPNNYSCTREIDLVEFSRAWTFHPGNCSFDLDRFAHLVQNEDKKNRKQGTWYQETRADKALLERAIEQALKQR